MYRLFIAIDFPADIMQQLSRLCYGLQGARWVPEEQLHLTLRFIGEVDGSVYRDIRETLADVRAEPFRLALKGIGHFPPRGKPRVLWAGVERSEKLLLLRGKVESALARIGLEPEGRKYSPHITLARFKESINAAKVAQYIIGNNLFSTMPFTVDRFFLYSSQLTQKGALHTVEAEYPLREGAGSKD